MAGVEKQCIQTNEVGHAIHDVGTEELVLDSFNNNKEIGSREMARNVTTLNEHTYPPWTLTLLLIV